MTCFARAKPRGTKRIGRTVPEWCPVEGETPAMQRSIEAPLAKPEVGPHDRGSDARVSNVMSCAHAGWIVTRNHSNVGWRRMAQHLHRPAYAKLLKFT